MKVKEGQTIKLMTIETIAFFKPETIHDKDAYGIVSEMFHLFGGFVTVKKVDNFDGSFSVVEMQGESPTDYMFDKEWVDTGEFAPKDSFFEDSLITAFDRIVQGYMRAGNSGIIEFEGIPEKAYMLASELTKLRNSHNRS